VAGQLPEVKLVKSVPRHSRMIWGIGWPQSLGQFVSIRFTDEKPQKPNAMQNRYP